MSASEKEQGACAPVEPPGALDADAAKAIAAYRENLAHTLGGRDLLRVFLIVDDVSGVGAVGDDIAEIDRNVIVGPAGGIERWAGIITDVVERLNRQPDAESLDGLLVNAPAPTPCTLNLRDAAKAPEPTYRDYAEIEKYRKSESPALGGSEICYLHVGREPREDSGGTVPVHGQTIIGPRGTVEQLIQHVDAVAGKFAGGGVAGNVDAPTDAQPTRPTPEPEPTASAERTYWATVKFGDEPCGRAAIARHRELFPADILKVQVFEPSETADNLYIADWQIGGPHGLIEGFCAELDELVSRYGFQSAQAMKLATAAMGGDTEAAESEPADTPNDDEADAETDDAPEAANDRDPFGRRMSVSVWSDSGCDGDCEGIIEFWGGGDIASRIVAGCHKLAAEIAADHAADLPGRFQKEADRLQAAANLTDAKGGAS